MSAPPSPTLSDSALLDSLEDDPRFDLSIQREKRLEQLNHAVQSVRVLSETEYGRVVTYGEEKKLIERMAKDKYVLIHFFHPEFSRCRIMDKKLDEIAPKYPHTLFLRGSVADLPFLVTKLSVQVLPCVMIFVDGRCVDRLIGFEELGDTDQFTSAMLEFRLKSSGAFPIGPIKLANTLPTSLLHSNGNGNGNGNTSDRSDESDDEKPKYARRGKKGIRGGLLDGSDDGD